MYIMVAGLLFGNIVATGFLSYVSHHNYPGGVALSKLHQVVETTRSEFYFIHYEFLCSSSPISHANALPEFLSGELVEARIVKDALRGLETELLRPFSTVIARNCTFRSFCCLFGVRSSYKGLCFPAARKSDNILLTY